MVVHKCNLCRSNRLFSYRRHLIKHNWEVHYQCNWCQRQFNSLSGLEIHFNVVHGGHASGQHKCNYEKCGKSFKKLKHLRQHMTADHYSDDDDDDDDDDNVVDGDDSQSPSVQSLQPSPPIAPLSPTSCRFCLVRMGSKKKLKKHERQAHHWCKVCGDTFADSQSLARHQDPHHMRNQHKRKRKDPRTRLAVLANDNIVLQQQEMSYTCGAPGCGQQFRQKVDFYRHKYSIHIKFICNFGDCDQQFPTHNEMIVHKTVEHYKFKCDYIGCTDGFGDQSALEYHKRDKHNFEKCDYFGCNMWFKTETDLSHHMNSHYGDNCYELLVESYIQKGP
ncbi:zinc finger protein 471-like [Oppia nitens]|uniref:zinc finger protein 471-like n=1 Tax=Oppia nitens TaxID=1686743 RepID=UPI0023DC8505|nr:zinc finger protein 471-like [Oppia nitens]XP_054165671.1 zinc finger protein 471-like [Oppia nitens]